MARCGGRARPPVRCARMPCWRMLDLGQNQPAKETVTVTTTSYAPVSQPNTAAAFRKIKLLVGGYAGISLLGVAAIVLMRQHPAEVNSAVWVQGIVVAASALVAFNVAARAARGSRWAYRRLRILFGGHRGGHRGQGCPAGHLPAVGEGRAGHRRPLHDRRRGAGQ